MTHEAVDEMEDKLRQAQRLVEESAQIVCNERGEHAPEIWNKLTVMANDIGELIHPLWKLRPEE